MRLLASPAMMYMRYVLMPWEAQRQSASKPSYTGTNGTATMHAAKPPSTEAVGVKEQKERVGGLKGREKIGTRNQAVANRNGKICRRADAPTP